MNFATRNLLDKLIQFYGGSYERINKRLFWHSPEGKTYHVSTVFLKRMVLSHSERELKNVQPTQESVINERTEQQPRSEEVTAFTEKTETQENKESNKKKKDRPKKTVPKMEDEEKSGPEDKIATEEKDENI